MRAKHVLSYHKKYYDKNVNVKCTPLLSRLVVIMDILLVVLVFRL